MNHSLIDLIIQSFSIGLQIAIPFLLVSLLVGLIVGLIQAATQINEPSIAFLLKVGGFVLCMILFGPWAFSQFKDNFHSNIQAISHQTLKK